MALCNQHKAFASDLGDNLSCYLWCIVANGSAGTGGRGVLVPEGNRQITRWQADRSALGALQVPEADRLPWQSQLQSDPLCWQGWLQLWSVAAQEHGSTQRERRLTAAGVVARVHENHLEGRSVQLKVIRDVVHLWIRCIYSSVYHLHDLLIPYVNSMHYTCTCAFRVFLTFFVHQVSYLGGWVSEWCFLLRNYKLPKFLYLFLQSAINSFMYKKSF